MARATLNRTTVDLLVSGELSTSLSKISNCCWPETRQKPSWAFCHHDLATGRKQGVPCEGRIDLNTSLDNVDGYSWQRKSRAENTCT